MNSLNSRWAVHFRAIVYDAIKSGFRILVSHIFLFMRVVFLLLVINVAVFMVGAGLSALYFKLQHPSLDVTGLIKSYVAQCTPLSSCSLEEFMQVLKMQLTQDGATVEGLVAKGLFGLAVLAMIQTILFVWSSLGFARVTLDLYDTSRSKASRIFSVLRYIPRAIGSFLLCMSMMVPGVIVGGIGAYIARLLCLSECGIFEFILSIPALIFFAFIFIRVRYFPFLIIDRNIGAFQAVTYSFSLTHGFTLFIFMQLGVFWLMRFGLSLIPVVGPLINMLIIYPVEYASSAYVYRYMESNR